MAGLLRPSILIQKYYLPACETSEDARCKKLTFLNSFHFNIQFIILALINLISKNYYYLHDIIIVIIKD